MKINFKMFNYLLGIWNYISLLNIDRGNNGLQKLRIQLLNQYNFLLGLIFLSYAIRDVFYGFVESYIILGTASIFLLLTLFFTTLRFNKHIVFSTCVFLTMVIFFFTSYSSVLTGTYMYNFAFITAIIFLFGSKDMFYIAILYSLTIVFFLINYFTDFKLFFNAEYESKNLYTQNLLIAFLETLALLCVNGIYLHKRFQLHLKIVRARYRLQMDIMKKKDSIGRLENKLKKELPYDIEYLITMANSSSAKFMPEFIKVFPDLFDQLLEINPKITSTEFKTLALIRLGFNTKDIANLEYVSIRTIETRKNRIRRNFGLASTVNLYVWIKAVGEK
ncbi:hypothetical protein [Sphingobacterium sp.]|uniref:helix-turn-helix transcriptional regulator n=1 Tax=Sphingobacterium sp. TaxID=341027 RepID=UPI00289DB281|nr:hypothetical protein [Sphingobacterium sp.]